MKKVLSLSTLLFLIPSLAFPGYAQRINISSCNNLYYIIYQVGRGTKILSKYSITKKEKTIYYTLQDENRCSLVDVFLDLTSSKVGYSDVCNLSPESSATESNIRYYVLNILDIKTKKLIAKLSNAGGLASFSPSGNAIVYAEQIPGERGSPVPPGYKGGVWIYDFKTKTKKSVSAMADDINWSEHDGNIYVFQNIYMKPTVYRYNPIRGEIENTPYRGIYFSSDGKYYSNQPFEEYPSKLFRTSDNKEMVDWETMMGERGSKEFPGIAFKFWSRKLNAAIFSVVPSGTENVVFDVGRGRIIGQFSGKVIGTNAQGTLVAVHPPLSSKASWAMDKVEILNLIELTSKYQSKK